MGEKLVDGIFCFRKIMGINKLKKCKDIKFNNVWFLAGVDSMKRELMRLNRVIG